MSDPDDMDQMTLEQLEDLEQWMYDEDVRGENYYDERMKVVQEIENRRHWRMAAIDDR